MSGAEELDCVKARTSDLSEHRQSDLILSPSPCVKATSCKDGGTLALALAVTPAKDKDRASPIGVGMSMENLTLDATYGSASASGLGSGGKKITCKLSSLEVMRAALQSIDVHNWSLFA
jgi:hypothetical protein